ncbi:hypothetical protein TNCV_2164881 [Trichonephila clavipes]|nr:hypothetical protein TNCV_2164881 [Trichonephila clavipes]
MSRTQNKWAEFWINGSPFNNVGKTSMNGKQEQRKRRLVTFILSNIEEVLTWKSGIAPTSFRRALRVVFSA